MLVVDLDALQAIDVLNLLDQVARQRGNAQQAQDIMWIRLTIGDHLALGDTFTFEDRHVPPLRDQLLIHIALRRCDYEALLAFRLTTQADDSADSCKYRRLLWLN